MVRALTELAARDPAHRRVGFVLVFASDDVSHIAGATETATEVVRLLPGGSTIFADSRGLGYWNSDKGNIEFKVFLMN